MAAAEQAAARIEVDTTVAANAACPVDAELEALRSSNVDNSVSTGDSIEREIGAEPETRREQEA